MVNGAVDREKADIVQSFGADLGFAEHPWVMVLYGRDHVHLPVSRRAM